MTTRSESNQRLYYMRNGESNKLYPFAAGWLVGIEIDRCKKMLLGELYIIYDGASHLLDYYYYIMHDMQMTAQIVYCTEYKFLFVLFSFLSFPHFVERLNFVYKIEILDDLILGGDWRLAPSLKKPPRWRWIFRFLIPERQTKIDTGSIYSMYYMWLVCTLIGFFLLRLVTIWRLVTLKIKAAQLS